MNKILKLALLTLLYVSSINCADCYWRGFPWCGLFIRCKGDDHRLYFGTTWQCGLNIDKYCCPSGQGADIAFCEDIDFEGNCFSHSIQDNKCINLDKNDVASSVNTFGGCFRLYEDENCQGRSIVVQPGTRSHNNLEDLAMNDMVTSVSMCLSTDKCDNDNRYKRSNGNNCQWANEVLTLGFLPWLIRDTSNLDNSPVVFYQIGPHGRTEVMEAYIYVRHLNTGTSTNQVARNFARSMGNFNDDAGHILAQRLGGSGTDLRNIFPQSPNINRGVWSQVEETISQLVLLSRNGVRFTVNLEYHSREDTRPYQIVFRIRINDNDWMINDMINP